MTDKECYNDLASAIQWQGTIIDNNTLFHYLDMYSLVSGVVRSYLNEGIEIKKLAHESLWQH